MPTRERVMLMEALKDGQELLLLDGRKLLVNPADMPTCCTWTPTDLLEIYESEPTQGGLVKIRRLSCGSTITGYWE